MAQTINSNIMSINSQRLLNQSQNSMATSIQRLTSGLRINSAKDDAAGLAVSESMTSKIRGLNMAERNANDGISLAQTAEAALGQMTNNMQRIRELAVQSSNGTLGDSERAHLQAEVDQLTQENSRIVQTTEFNGKKLFSGGSNIDIQIGASQGETITIGSGISDMSSLNSIATSLTATNTIDITSSTGAQAVLATGGSISADINTVVGARAKLGAIQNRFESVISNIGSYSENLQAARSRITDTDYAAETANLTRSQILQQAGTAMVAQANSVPQGVLSLL
ncbi:MAG: flagellin N-terminal helical domain-containing protein [Thiotrichales bacterium]